MIFNFESVSLGHEREDWRFVLHPLDMQTVLAGGEPSWEGSTPPGEVKDRTWTDPRTSTSAVTTIPKFLSPARILCWGVSDIFGIMRHGPVFGSHPYHKS